MEKDGKVRIMDSCFIVRYRGLMLGEVRIQFDLLPGVESILGHCNFIDLDDGDSFSLDFGKDDLDEA